MTVRVERVSVVFPIDLWDKVKALVAPGERSRLVVEATRQELYRRELLAALEAGEGAWTDEHHPELKSLDNIHSWLAEQRTQYFPQREGAE